MLAIRQQSFIEIGITGYTPWSQSFNQLIMVDMCN